VNDIGILKATDDLHDGVDLADRCEELVAQAFALAGAGDQSGNVDEFDGGGHDNFRLRNDLQCGEPLIRHDDHADIRIDRTEWIIGGLCFAGAGEGVEESGLTHVGQSDDTGFEHEIES
jgi:hypothetical protein